MNEKTLVLHSSNKNKISNMNKSLIRNFSRTWELYLFILPALLCIVIFQYIPMYGVQIAFKDFAVARGIFGSKWVEFDHFIRFFHSYYFAALIKNTLGISLYSLVLGFPIPVLLALSINELKNGFYKKLVQTVTYAPHFISIVVITGLVISFLSPSSGIINNIIKAFGGSPVKFLMEPSWFKTIYVVSGIWQNAGWGTIIYLAALTSIDIQQHEAAIMDGATRLQRVWYINIPGILPTMIIILILDAGKLMSVGFEKIFLLQNPINMEASDVISTYVYRSGLLQAQYSFSAAVGLFNSVVNFILLVMVNRIAKYTGETSLW